MTDVFEEIVALLRSERASRMLAERHEIADPGAAGNAAALAVPIMLDGLAEWAHHPIDGPDLLGVLQGIRPGDPAQQVAGLADGTHARVGRRLVPHLLARSGQIAHVGRLIGEEAEVDARLATDLLAPVAGVVADAVATRLDGMLSMETLVPLLADEHRLLEERGWASWLEATSEVAAPTPQHRARAEASPAAPVDDRVPASSVAGSVETEEERTLRLGVPPPVTRSARLIGEGEAEVSGGALGAARHAPYPELPPEISDDPRISARPQVEAPERAAHDGGWGSTQTMTRPQRTAESRGGPWDGGGGGPTPVGLDRGERRGGFGGLLIVLILFLVAGAALLWWTTRDDTSTSAGDASGDGAAQQTDGATDGTTSGDGTEGDGTGGDTGQLAGPSPLAAEVVSMDVPMVDILGVSTATGTVELTFDKAAEQLCFHAVSDGVGSPYDGHIHIGPEGVKGGIVIDFGAVDNDTPGCVIVPRSQLEAILAEPAGHYAEMHDPSETFTIRGQLTAGTLADGTPVADVAPPEAAADELAFDADSSGAVAVIEDGRLFVRGQVTDRETAEQLLSEFAVVPELLVVDELTLNPNAPLPSGRLAMDSAALFAVDSAELSPEAGDAVDLVVALLQAHPDWRIAVVGHTDSTGNEVSNLELSLERAQAVTTLLVEAGIDPLRVTSRGAGATQPAGDNDTAEGRALNRRIEIEVSR